MKNQIGIYKINYTSSVIKTTVRRLESYAWSVPVSTFRGPTHDTQSPAWSLLTSQDFLLNHMSSALSEHSAQQHLDLRLQPPVLLDWYLPYLVRIPSQVQEHSPPPDIYFLLSDPVPHSSIFPQWYLTLDLTSVELW